jgi:hypothetical protein
MTPEYIIRASLSRPAHCSSETPEQRAQYIEDLTFSHEYAEGGYTQPEKGILFANWNYFARDLDRILERYGYEVEWSDEWTTCSECNRALRTTADCYFWQPSYGEMEGDILCIDCLTKDAESYLESLEDNPRTALNIRQIDPAAYGYMKLEGEFESGFHPGQTDDPKKIYARLCDTHPRLLFRIDEVSQFYTVFSVWQKYRAPALYTAGAFEVFRNAEEDAGPMVAYSVRDTSEGDYVYFTSMDTDHRAAFDAARRYARKRHWLKTSYPELVPAAVTDVIAQKIVAEARSKVSTNGNDLRPR